MPRSTRSAAIALAALFALAAAGAPAQDQEAPSRPGREVSLPPSEVKDTFFAYMLGIIAASVETRISREEMRDVLVEFKSAMGVPFDLFSLVTQHVDQQTGERTVGLEFQHDVVVPVPFAILFYHPGSVALTERVIFDVHQSTWAEAVEGTGEPRPGAPVYDLEITEGSILVNIDAWLKALFSASLEDTWIRHVVFFKWHDDWMAMLQGNGRASGRVHRVYFNLARNAIMFPTPQSLKDAGREVMLQSSAGR